jgi:hypothetical protein
MLPYIVYIHRVSCIFREVDQLKAFPHCLHTSVFSPLCGLSFFSIALKYKKAFPYYLQTVFFSLVSLFMFVKDTQMKQGFATLLTCKGCLSSVTTYMPFKESGSSKGFPTILH